MRLDPLDVSPERLVPDGVLAALREIDPTLTLIHLSRDRWLLAYLCGSGEQIARGRRLLENTKRVLASLAKKGGPLPPQVRAQRRERLVIATVKALGGIGCRVIRTREPDGSLVAQVRADDFYHRHASEADFWRDYDALSEQAEAERLKDLTDPARANDAWRYSHTLNHAPGVFTTPSQPTSSARTRVRTIA